MADSIDSSSDIQRQLDELEKAELEVEPVETEIAGPGMSGAAGDIQTGRSRFPKWVLWMIVADVVIGIAVVVIVFAA